MFENKPTNNEAPKPPVNLPVEDIFSGLDQETTTPPVAKISTPIVPAKEVNLAERNNYLPVEVTTSRRWFWLGLIGLVVVIIVVALIWFFVSYFSTPAGKVINQTNQNINQAAVPAINSPDGNLNSNLVIPAENINIAGPAVGNAFIDTDRDGLSDEEEAILGTDLTKIDTDGDGLTDYEEVKIYKTNPLNPDTDGDSFSDGAEVKKGYDPKGPGKLFNLPTSSPNQ
ncbi:MAG: hypothetical protein WCW02_01865 [Candidatus Buchananbacteria bacterium]